MKWKWLVSSARGATLVLALLIVVLLLVDNLAVAVLAGSGLGSMLNPVVLIITLVGMFIVNSGWAAIATGLGAGFSGRLFGISRLEPVNIEREITVILGTAMLVIFLIGLADFVRYLIDRRRSGVI